MNNLDVKKEIDRRKSTTARMLEAFKLKRELTTADLLKFGNGCSSRLFELRKEGHKIVAIYERPGFYRYVYKGHPDDVTPLAERIVKLPLHRRLWRTNSMEQED